MVCWRVWVAASSGAFVRFVANISAEDKRVTCSTYDFAARDIVRPLVAFCEAMPKQESRTSVAKVTQCA